LCSAPRSASWPRTSCCADACMRDLRVRPTYKTVGVCRAEGGRVWPRSMRSQACSSEPKWRLSAVAIEMSIGFMRPIPGIRPTRLPAVKQSLAGAGAATAPAKRSATQVLRQGPDQVGENLGAMAFMGIQVQIGSGTKVIATLKLDSITVFAGVAQKVRVYGCGVKLAASPARQLISRRFHSAQTSTSH
jgi:hypothetical protein